MESLFLCLLRPYLFSFSFSCYFLLAYCVVKTKNVTRPFLAVIITRRTFPEHIIYLLPSIITTSILQKSRCIAFVDFFIIARIRYCFHLFDIIDVKMLFHMWSLLLVSIHVFCTPNVITKNTSVL